MILQYIPVFCTIALALINLLTELKRDLMMMQQNSYRNERYLNWLRTSGDTTSWARLTAICLLLISMTQFISTIVGLSLVSVFSLSSAISLLRRRYKKPLVWTPRARRIYTVCLLLSAILTVVVCLLAPVEGLSGITYAIALTLLALYCGSHIITMSAIWLLKPLESHINRGYRNDAARILASMPRLKVIGITGSYGKTSTKHYLNRILSEQFEVLMTPGSYNTTLGVIRTIREMMKPYTEIFICEMGAKNIGDIRDICELVHPTIGIVTAVGPQHLESFKTIENVRRTKFELIDSLPADGLAVVNDDFEPIALQKISGCNSRRYSLHRPEADFHATSIVYSPNGSSFTIEGPDMKLDLHTRLVGECNVSNLVAAVIVALHLGMPHEKIRRAVEAIEPVEHRLSIKRTPAGITILDDAFNSNPAGSSMALDVLSAMTGGRRIIITPGMIELGERQQDLNREFGRKIASSADIAIIVGQYNREAISGGIKEGEGSPEVYEVASFAEAQQILQPLVKSGDTVLYENDLPDTFK